MLAGSREICQQVSTEQNNRLRDVRFVRMPSFVTIIMSCALFILRSAFRVIGSRVICQQPSVDQNNRLKFFNLSMISIW